MPIPPAEAKEQLVEDDRKIHVAEFGLANTAIETVTNPDGSSTIYIDLTKADPAGQRSPLEEHAVKDLAGALSIPTNYLAKCPATLQGAQIAHWIQEVSDQSRKNAVSDGVSVQGIVSPKFYPSRNSTLLESLIDSIESAASNGKVQVDFYAHSWVHSVLAVRLVDDEIGLLLSNSLVNFTKLEVQAYKADGDAVIALPLLDEDKDAHRYLSDMGDPYDWAKAAGDKLRGFGADYYKKVDDAKTTTLTDEQRVVASMISTTPGPLRQPFVEAYDALAPLGATVYRVALALSNAAIATDLRTDQKLWAFRHAGHFLVQKDCTTCHRLFVA